MLRERSRRAIPHAASLLVILALTSCATEPPRTEHIAQRVATSATPDTNVYFYPAQGREIPAAQQDRDRYECYAWAVQQTGFDPNSPSVAPHQRVRAVPSEPSGAGIAVGGVTGAMIGAATANPWNAGPNILIGALAGAAIGGVAEAAQVDHAQAEADAAARYTRNAALDEKAAEYRRAMSACLEGRGYSVR